MAHTEHTPHKICIVTGTRAEWGLLSRLAAYIRADNDLALQIVATNMHLARRYGETYKEIEAEGFTIDYRVPMIDDTDDDQSPERATVLAMSRALKGFAEGYDALRPDMLVVLGDRYEILCAVQAALIFRIPVAHLHGGEITEGAFDDAIRHAITEMSHLHFTATEEYRQRVIQLGESPDRVYNVGAIGVDNIKQIPLWPREETERSLGGFALDRQTLLVTYHPVTLENNTAESQITTLLDALDHTMTARPGVRVIFTMPNSDTGNGVIAERIQTWCAAPSRKARCVWFTSLGLKRYLSVLQYIGGVVGNSSSGIIEVPSFHIPTLNIGDRQKGRIAARSVVDCAPDKGEIIEKLSLLLTGGIDVSGPNPYERPDTAQLIYETLKQLLAGQAIAVRKHFYDLPHITE